MIATPKRYWRFERKQFFGSESNVCRGVDRAEALTELRRAFPGASDERLDDMLRDAAKNSAVKISDSVWINGVVNPL